jgi:hypothetical protein
MIGKGGKTVRPAAVLGHGDLGILVTLCNGSSARHTYPVDEKSNMDIINSSRYWRPAAVGTPKFGGRMLSAHGNQKLAFCARYYYISASCNGTVGKPQRQQPPMKA